MKRIFMLALVSLVLCATSALGQATTPAENDVVSQYNKIRKMTGEALQEKKPVLMYFYSESIPDSREELPAVQELASKNNALLIDMEALDQNELRRSYEIEYVPTIVAIRPEAGVVAKWIVDIPMEEVTAVLEGKGTPIPTQVQMGNAIKNKKPQMLFFMAKWCGYCMNLLPQVMKFKEDYSDRVEVIPIDIDADKGINRWLQGLYGVGGFPTILVVDQNGVIVGRSGYPDGYEQYRLYFKALGVDMDKISLKSPETGKSQPTGM